MSNSSMEAQWANSQLSGGNADYLEQMYEQYLNDSDQLPEEWRAFFQQLPQVNGFSEADVSHQEIREQFRQLSRHKQIAGQELPQNAKQAHVVQLVYAYRHYGHFRAKLDPLQIMEVPATPMLDLKYNGLSDSDLDTEFDSGPFFGLNSATLRDINAALQATYCGTIGCEFKHITNKDETNWLYEQLETQMGRIQLDANTKQHLLKRLISAEGLEKYLGNRYVGQKRFSLEGAGSLIPLLDEVINRAGNNGVKEIVMGMAHRGRLNVLINILGKSPQELFHEFEGKVDLSNPNLSGDVKYHMGFSADRKTAGGNVHMALSFNPSHLEIINPVVEGSVRARQDRRKDEAGVKVMPILMHGDSAFAGQGIVQEVFNMSQTRGYYTGGTVHIIINNQIGFTTSNPHDTRSTHYCSDAAKMIQAPIFHVNGDDVEAVYRVAQIALDYRMKFNKDVVIDLVCYRRHGHQEADEPTGTQPLMYQKIKQHPSPRELYAQQLIEQKIIEQQAADQYWEQYKQSLDKGEQVFQTTVGANHNKYAVDWSPFLDQTPSSPGDTRYPLQKCQALGVGLTTVSENLALQTQVRREIEARQKMVAGDLPLNWGCAETLAYATLLNEGVNVRISGQDSGRGTFSHRHAVLHDQKTGERYIPLQHISDEQGNFTIIDSVLSEAGVLGFEYGYATASPYNLVIWEAQFGDFANNAQVVIDQFISSGQQKWDRLSGLVMYLPHGYEGQGPEHSSARLERYLQLCAQHNMQVCVPSTPAQHFHMIRRQVIRPFRAPLIVMTPKSLLRHKLATSTMDDLANGEFHLLISEIDADVNYKNVTRVVICSGKVYYDLLEQRRANKQTDVAILRIEQLYPFPVDLLAAELAKYKKAKQVVWCQEEPKNQGAWFCSHHHLDSCLADWQTLGYAGRDFSASPACGYPALHKQQQEQLINEALASK